MEVDPIKQDEGQAGMDVDPSTAEQGPAEPAVSNTAFSDGFMQSPSLDDAQAQAVQEQLLRAASQALAQVQRPLALEAQQPAVKQEETPADQTPAVLQPTTTVVEIKTKSGAYTAREEYLQQLEREGAIAFVYVKNDGQPQNMIRLIGLKNIFSKQLPNMPKEYICRLVLDRRHRSVALVKRNGTVVGGITYRIFPEGGFGEIAFCAITASEQVKGFGTRLMNYTKDYALHLDGLTHFLTYADNNAVGYFQKQGFTKEITLAKDRWYGWIKDYDGGTLMECVMHPHLYYAKFPEMMQAQRGALESHIKTWSSSYVVRPGLTQFSSPGKHEPVPIIEIPGVAEAGWTADKYGHNPRYALYFDGKDGGTVPVNSETLQKFMEKIWFEVSRSEEAWPFLQPVSKEEVPDYFDIIKDPIDLSLIEKRLKDGNFYITLDIFIADLKRMFANCRVYNAPDTVYYKVAAKLDSFLDSYLRTHLIYPEDVER